jgi:bifunctional non-homologous end joining protein LigD
MARRRSSLTTYAAKRAFSATPEPRPGPASAKQGWRFVVQKHDASSLHYDLRLELGGVLKSWAVPKGPSLSPADKRLAVQVEDHPLAYRTFEGMIPKGQYGGGAVLVWDEGRWEPLDDDPAAALKRGRLSFALHGSKLRGGWLLTRLRKERPGKPQWLLIKRRDSEADERGPPVVEAMPRSVRTDRTIEDIAAPEDAKEPARRRGTTVRRSPARAGAASLPVVEPQLCTLADAPPEGDGWLHEIKYDGYRLLIFKNRNGVRTLTRRGLDWTDRFPPIARAVSRLRADRAILDGEAVVLDEHDNSSFQRLQRSIKARRFDRLVFFAFDLLLIDGEAIAEQPLQDRKARLRRLLGRRPPAPLRYSEHIAGHGSAVHAQACRAHLEGVVSKRADAAYTPGRSRTWIKSKCGLRQEFVIAGYTQPGGSRRHLGALSLAVHDDDGRLMHAGRVGTGFDTALLKDLHARLHAIRTDRSPLDIPPSPGERRGVAWVRPVLVAEIAFAGWTDDRRVRQASFKGLREDKDPEDIRIEVPMSTPKLRKPARRTVKTEAPVIAGVRITHSNRPVYPNPPVTKGDVAEYYRRVADRILPYLVDRPLSTVRCPDGVGGASACFFQKHVGRGFPPAIRRIPVRESAGISQYIGVESVEGLVTLVQFGVIELHPWGATTRDLERPDQMTIDLDPGEGIALGTLKAAAGRVRKLLQLNGLRAFLKSTGGKGLHIVCPLVPDADWSRVKDFAHQLAKEMVRQDPARFVAVGSKSARRGRIFVDYLRNSRGATSVAPLSLRARPGATIAAPLSWQALPSLRSAAPYSISSKIPAGWPGYERARRPLPARFRST